ncbi:iron complex outermembrane receptor protein [Sphingomonas vulcanisoli]|uniref:Iron complex outermembrane receptor protein n=1 Tax=Sphingomonas vulcanisoli TaxID=1658060 RepID=A0ABX0TP78_9SPHN|nr:TonB-dependent receptor [Sphingomonas vulcanisoli]NIJ07307.1 iron complex outermembrane receptor protein [Sphingomonas vulcanisoli]
MKHRILASASVLAIVASPAYAQTVPAGTASQTTTPAPSSEEQAGLQDIIVTAQRTEQSAQKAPVAIAVVAPQELIRQNVTRAEDLSRVVPALVATASGGPNTSFFLRGVGNTTVNSYSDPAISFNYDGVYIGRPNSTQGFFYDLQRVEVLKGPQGTLYGRNATGGAINVLPRRPEIGVTSGEIQASYGNYNAVHAQGAVNLPIADSGAFRLAGTYDRHDGYYSDGTGDQKQYGARAQVLANLTPNLTTRVGVDYQHQGGVGSGSYIYGTFAYTGPTTGFVFTPTPQLGPKVGVADPRTEAFIQTRFIAQAGRNSEAINSYPSQNDSVWGATSETNWKTSAGTLTVQAAYRESQIAALSTTSNFRSFRQDEHAHQVTLETRFAGKIGTIADYLIGGFFFDENINNRSSINQITLTPFQNYITGTTSKAAFGRLALHVTDTLTLTGAGRYTDDVKRMNGLSNVFTLFCGAPTPPQDFCPNVPLMPLVFNANDLISFYTSRGVAFGPPGSRGPNTPTIFNTQIAINSKLITKKFTYRGALDWQFTPRNLVYVSYETGFHGGGFNFGRGLETYKPETISALTVGSKNRFFNNRLQLNIEGFYWKYKDQQISQFGTDFSSPPISVFYTSNIGSSTIKGIDVDGEFLLTPTTRIGGSVQYLKTSYDSYAFTSSLQSPTPPNFACPYTVTTQYNIDCSGKPALFSPKWSFNVNASQTIKLDGFKLVLEGGTRWRGDFYAATSYQPWVISKATFQSDASATLSPDSEWWSVTAFVNNIENKRRLTQSNTNGTLNTQSGLATAPRTFGVRLGARFK